MKSNSSPLVSRTNKLLIETLEDRILYDAVPGADGTPEEENPPVHTETVELPEGMEDPLASLEIGADDDHDFLYEVETDGDLMPIEAIRHELLVVDGNISDASLLTDDLLNQVSEGIQMASLLINPDQAGFATITAFLEEQAALGIYFDAIHVISHASQGQLGLGSSTYRTADLAEGQDAAIELAKWRDLLLDEADILLYGCHLGAGENGSHFIHKLSAATGADVAASTDLTGSVSMGGNWVLEVATGSIESSVLVSTLDMILPSGAQPEVTVDAPGSVRLGETANITVTFVNATSNNITGYGPWIDVIFDQTGVDGIFDPANPNTGSGVGIYDGFTLTGNPAYLGVPLNTIEITLDDSANGGLGVLHPYALDALGQPIYLNAGSANDPFDPLHDPTSPYNDLLQGFRSGDKLLVIELPFGSFTPGQPPAEVNFSLELSELADLDAPLNIRAQGGFRFGEDPLNNPTVDPVIIGGAVGTSTVPVNTTLADFEKTFDGPEGETATGPNFQRTYTISVNIADNQTFSDFNIFDRLPDEIQFLAIGQVTAGGVPISEGAGPGQYTVVQAPDPNFTGGFLQIRLNDDVTGGAGTDITLEIEFYVPREYDLRDANGDLVTGDPADREEVLSSETGIFIQVENQAYGYGTWVPLDTRDPSLRIGFNADVDSDPLNPANPIPSEAPENVFSAQSIAIQKGVNILQDTGFPGATSGDILQYNVDFQISDYFAFDQIIITDTMSDGQLFLQNATFFPTLTIAGNGFSLALDFDPAFYTVDFFDDTAGPTLGNTTITFDVSAQLIAYANSLTAGEIALLDPEVFAQMQAGMLLGGGVNPNSPGDVIANDLSGFDAGGTVGQILFQALILDQFEENFPSGEPHLNPRDTLTNEIIIEGRVLQLDNALAPSIHVREDDSGASITIVADEVRKDIFAVNGILRLTNPADLNSAENPAFTTAFRDPSGAILLQPGDEVTYRLYYTLPTGDVEQLRFSDFFPLPVFDVTDPNGDGNPSNYSFDNNLADVSNFSLVSGDITYGPSHTAHSVTGPGAASPTLIVDSIANSLRLEWGDFTSETNLPTVVDVLVTMRVSNDPFADGLFLTNQVQSGEQNTQNPGVENEATTNAIIQINLGQPVVNIYKGVVASTQNGSVGTVGGLTFDAIGAGGDNFAGILFGQTNAQAIGNLDLISGTLPDAGDAVRYALVLQNTGRSDAFDVRFRDTILDSYVNDFADANDFAAATNFRVFRGDGTELTLGVDYILTWDNVTNEFNVELIDNYTAGNLPGDDKEGALSRGFNANIAEDIENGSNSVVVLYDLEVATSAQASSTIENTAELLSYSNNNGTPNHIPGGLTDDARVGIAPPSISKVLLGTEIDEPGNNAANQAVIGELVNYRITITVPEGTTAGAVLEDIMAPGLAFVEINDVIYSAGVSSTNTPGTGTNPANVTIGNANGGQGNRLTIDFGDIVNTDSDNGTLETITIDFTAVVLNVVGNQGGTTLGNAVNFEYQWADDPSGDTDTATLSDTAALVTVVEPSLVVANTLSYDDIVYVNDLSVDAGDVIFYRVVIANNGTVNAHNVSLYDRLPTVFDIGSTSIVSVTGGGFSTTDFEIVTDNKFGVDKPALQTTNDGTLQTLAPSDSVTIIIQTTIVDSIVSASTHPNGVEVRWTSIDDGIRSVHTDTDGMPGPMPGDDTPNVRSIHNPNSVERTGADGVGGPLNDYAATDPVNTTLRAFPVNSFLKTLEGTELVQPGNNEADEAVIGELVTYSIRFRVPEGVTNNLVITDVLDAGLGFVGFTGLSIAGGISSSTGLDSTSNAAALNALIGTDVQYTHTASNLENTLVIDLGNLTNTNFTNNAPPPVDFQAGQEIVITYQAVVLNTVGNQQNTELNNTATASYETVIGTDENSDEQIVEAAELTDSSENVRVIEPLVFAFKNVTREDPDNLGDPLTSAWGNSLTNRDAGDLVFYRIIISANVTTAFDVSLLDQLPAQFTSPALYNVSSSGTISFDGTTRGALAGDFNIAGGNLTNVANIDMQAGSSITVIVQGIISDNVGPNNLFNNTANIEWTSLDGVQNDLSTQINDGTDSERTGSGVGPNDYNGSDNASIRITPLNVVKQIVSTSEAHTSGSEVVIGEIVRYRLITRIPEGTMQNMQIRDFLPNGMVFMDDNTARVAFVSNSTISSSVIFLNGANVLGSSGDITPTFPIAGSQIELVGNQVRFNLGTLTNTNDNDANEEFVVIEFNALVTNVGTNVDGTNLNNSFQARVTNGTDVTSNTVTIEVVEPVLTVGKTVAVEPQDAGDDFEYTITISNNSGITAFNVSVEDLIDPFFNFYDRNGDTVIDLADALEIVSGPAGITLGNFEITDFTQGGPDNILQTTGNGFTLQDGETLVLRLYGRLSQSVPPAAEINNQVNIAWTSLPDDGTPAGSNPTGSQTPGNSGQITGERNGDGGVNSYFDSSSVVTTTVNEIALGKFYFGSSEGYTSDPDREAVIGETITYSLLVTLPESTLDGLIVTDLIPIGMQYVTGSATIITTVAGSFDWDGNPLLSDDFDGTFEDLGGGNIFTVTGGTGNGDNLSFTFGEIVVNASAATVSNSFLINLDLLVLNVDTNVDGTVLNNQGTAQVLDENGDPTGNSVSSNIVDVTVVEPELEVIKEVLGDVSGLDAGDTVTYRITIRHTGASNATAFDVVLTDTLPAELRNYVLQSATLEGNDVAVLFNLSGANLTTPGTVNLAEGEELELLITGIVRDDTVVGRTITNEAFIFWSSLEGGQRGDQAGIDDGFTDERTGVGGGANDYNDQDDVDVVTQGVLAINKVANRTTATIGEVITYTLEITVAEGRTEVNFTDTLPAGTMLVANSVQIGQNLAGLSITGLNANTLANQTLVVQSDSTGGTVGNDSSTVQTSTFTITYEVLVLNVAGNQDGLVLTNNVVATADLNDDGDTDDAGEEQTTETDVTVVEPELEVIKEVLGDVSGLDAGDTVTYRITIRHTGASNATAFDVVLTDTLPAELRNYVLQSATLEGNDVAVLFNLSGANLTTPGTVNLAEGEELELLITGIVRDDTVVGRTITNEAFIFWSSLEGGQRGDQAGIDDGFTDERTGVGGGANDYNDQDDVDVVTQGVLAINKVANRTTATIGEVITYTLEITVAEGRTEVNFTDTLPAGTMLVANSVQLASNPDGLSITGLLNNTLANQTLTVQSDSTGGTVGNDSSTVQTSTFTITYEVLVLNVAGNQDGLVLTNNVVATADLNDDGDTDDAGEEQTTETDVTVVEPELEVIKEVLGDVSGLDAGDTVTYRITIRHTGASNATAFDVVLTDTLPAELRDYVLQSATLEGNDVAVLFNLSGANLTTPGTVNLAEGEELELLITGIVRDDTVVGRTITNEAFIFWSSLEGGQRGDQAGIDDGFTDERTGVGGGANDYNDQDDVDVVTQGVLAINKVANRTTATIGEVITYTLEITVAEGRTEVNFTDTLPAGTMLVANSVQLASNPDGLSITGLLNNTLANQTLTVQSDSTGGTVGNDSSTVQTSTFTITYEVLVLNVAGNQDGLVLTNNVVATADLNDDGDTDDAGEEQTTETDVTVVEPELEVIKEVLGDVSGLDAGDTVTYRITIRHTGASNATAFDVVLTDTLPAELRDYVLQSATLEGNDVAVLFNLSGANLTTPGTVNLAEGEELELLITGIVRDDTVVGRTITNEAFIFWSSLEGGQRGDQAGIDDGFTDERTGVGGGANDYNDEDDVDVVTQGVLAINKVANRTTATIGEVITYTLEITVAEGRTEVNFTDTLPAGTVLVANSVQIGQNLAGLSITGLDANSLSNQTLTVQSDSTSGTVGDDSTTVQTSTFTITYEVLVLNVAGNQDGLVLTNNVVATADLNDDGDTDDAGEELTTETDVTVVEPELEVIKVVSSDASALDAGDTVEYTITIRHTGASNATAYDVVLTDTLPAELRDYVLQSATVGATDVSGFFDLNGANLTTPGTVNLAQGEELVLVISGIVRDDTVVGRTITNEAFIFWSSLEGGQRGDETGIQDDENDERTGVGGGVNDYNDEDDVDVVTQGVLAINKVADRTTASIGEVITYTLEITVAEGRTEVNFTDTLPAGTVLVANSVQIGQNLAGLSITGLDANSLSNQTLTVQSDSTSGTVGDDSTTVQTSTFTITYEVLVLNVAGNQDGLVLTNNVVATADLNDDGDTDDAGEELTTETDVTVVEPELEVIKVVSSDASALDAGDTVEYTITIRHTGASNATAYDVVLTDTLPAELRDYVLQSATVGATDVSGFFDLNGANLTTPGTVNLAQGEELVLVISGIVRDDTVVGRTITNEAFIFWSSLEGGQRGDETGIQDDENDERTGVGGGVNDYNDEDDVDVVTQGVLAINKVADRTTASIGEVITYTLEITVAEGRTEVNFTDTLPAGTVLVANSVQIGQNLAGLSITGLDANSLSNQTLTVQSDSTGGTVGDDSTTVQTSTFTITYEVLVLNVAGNQDGLVLTNNVVATADLNDDGDTDDAGEELTTETDVTVVEPELEVIKVVSSDASALDAGDTVEYTITIRHTGASNATAYDVVLTDTLPAELRDYVLQSATVGATDVSGFFDLNGANLTTPGTVNLAQGEELVLVISGIVRDDTVVGRTITNEAFIFWSSLEGGQRGDEAGIQDDENDERTGVGGGVNDYNDEDDVDVVTQGVLAINKVADRTTASIGEVITYTLEITVAEGRTEVNFTDTLPAGTVLVANSVQIGQNLAGLSITGLDANSLSNQTLTVQSDSTGGIVGDDSTTVQTSTFTITYEVLVLNVAGNQDGLVLTNNVVATADLNDDGDTDDAGEELTTETDVTVVEPELEVIKVVSSDASALDAGDTVEYTITIRHTGASNATAYDVVLTDTLPAELRDYVLQSAIVGATDVSSFFDLNGANLTTPGTVNLAQGEELVLVISGIVRDDTVVGRTITNEAFIFWSSLEGGQRGDETGIQDDENDERTGVGGGVNDYNDEDDVDVVTQGVLAINKVADRTTASIGEVITYTLEITVAEGRTEVNFTDTLPAGTVLVANSVQIGQNLAGLSITGLDANSLANQTLTVQSDSTGGTVGDDSTTVQTSTFTITYDVLVLNVAGNQDGLVLTNNVVATADLNDDGDTDDAGEELTTETDVTVVEPELEVIKVVSSDASALDAGDTLEYTITIRHTGASNATAYDVVLTDTLPAELRDYVLQSATVGATDFSGFFDLNGANLTTPGTVNLAQGEELVLVISGIVRDDTVVGRTITNEAFIFWSSLEGGQRGDETGIQDDENDERTGVGGGVNDYNDEDDVDVVTQGVLAINKVADRTTASIGEVITYTLEITVAEGRTEVNFTDTLPAGTVLVANSVQIGQNLAGLSITGLDANSLSNQTLTVQSDSTGGTVGDDSTTVQTSTFTITYEVLVLNVAGNQDGLVLTNNVVATADLNDDGDTDDAGEELTTETDVTVVEPELEVIKVVSSDASALDAGDTVEYTITIRHTGASNATAYDVVLTDTLPAELRDYVLQSATVGATDVSGFFDLNGANLTTPGTVNLAQGEELVLVVTGIVRDDTVVGRTITNEAFIFWSSLEGGQRGDETGIQDDENDERTGVGGGVNDYNDEDDVDVVTQGVLAINKVADRTTASIGEVITYTLEITVAEGRTEVNFTDTLPAGTVLVANSVQIGQNLAGLNITGLDANTLANQTLIVQSDSTGGTVGDDSTTVQTSTFTITYEVLVLNVAGNQDGLVLTNNVVATADLNDDGDTDDAGEELTTETDVTVVEPELEVIKVVSSDASALDAGDTVEYTITIRHTGASNATAYDVVLTDTLPAELRDYVLQSATVGATDVSGFFDLNGPNLTTPGTVNLAQGEELVLVVTGIVRDDTVVGRTITNEAFIFWSSLEGGQRGDETGIQDDENDERTGVGGGVNDYNDEDDVDVVTQGVLAINKVADRTTASIGEVITYTLEITVAEGRTEVNFTDTLPAGTVLVANSVQIGQNLAGLSITGLDANSLSNQTLTVQSDSTGGTVGDDSTTVQTSTFTITYEVLVLNVAGNQDGLVLTNNVVATADLNDDGDTDDAGEELTTETDVTVVEPELEVIKVVSSDASALDAGDTVEYTITIRHTGASNATAYDVVLTDTLPAELRDYVLQSATVGATDVSGFFDLNGPNLTTPGTVNLAQGEELVLVVTGIVRDDTVVGRTITNEAFIFWSSLEGGQRGDETGIQDDENDERTGVGGGVNDYNDEDDVDVVTQGVLAINKVADRTTASIGEVITYTLEITVAEGRTEVNFTDTLPAGTVLVANSVQIGQNLAGLSITGLDANSLSNQTLTVQSDSTSGTVGDDSTTVQTSTFTITYEVLVLNVAGNQDGLVLTNNVVATADLNDDGDTDDAGEELTTETDVTVVEPELEVIKVVSSDASALDAGDTVEYTITIRHTGASNATAYDVVLTDTLPAELRDYVLQSATVGATDVSGFFDLNGPNLTTPGTVNLAQGEELVLVISGIVRDDTVVGRTITNEAFIFWSSLEGGQRGDETGIQDDENDERTGVGGGVNDYNDEDDVDVVTQGVLAINKVADRTTASIGEVITYTLEITVAEGLTEVNFTDTLPAGTVLVANSVQIGQNLAGLNITGLDANTLSNQTLLVQSDSTGGTVGDDSTTVQTSTFTITYEVLVLNVADNQDGLVLTNSVVATADLNDDGDTEDPGEELTTDTDVTVVEPELEVLKVVSSDASALDAGDTVEYTITIRHTGASTATAYDVVLTDTLPAELRDYVLQSATVGATDVSGLFDLAGANLTTPGTLNLAQGEELVLVVTGIVRDDTVVGRTINNEAFIFWSSLENGQRGDETGIQDDENDERTGVGGGANDYNDEDDVDVVTQGVLAINKVADRTTASIGEVITYTLEITVAEGRTEVNFTDTLPAGTVLVANSVQIGQNLAGLNITGLDANTLANQTLTVQSDSTGGTVGDDSTTVQTSTFTITYEVLVLNVVGNQDGLVLTNNVVATADLNDDGDTDDAGEELTTETDVTVVEPVLEIIKTSDDEDSFVAAGQLVTYTLTIRHTGDSTANAFDLIINDPLPGELENFQLLRADIGATSVLGSLNLDVVTGVLSTTGTIDLALGEELIIEVSGSVILGTPGSTVITNVGEVLWSSLPGGQSGDDTGISDGINDERTGSGGINDYNDDNAVALTVGLGSIGDIVWWDVNGNGVQDPFELGLPGLTVNLWRDDNGDGILDAGDFFITSTITDENGFYLFENLPTEFDDGLGNVTQIQYIVEVVPLDSYIQTFDLDGIETTPNTAAVVLDAGNEDRRDVDFGYRGTGSVGDTVWNDVNLNGILDPGEQGIPNVGVQLTFFGGLPFGGQTLTLNTTTNGEGQYLFNNLIGGNYRVIIDTNTLPAGMFVTFDLNGSLDGTANFSLAEGQNRRDVDFGAGLPIVPPIRQIVEDDFVFAFDVFNNFAQSGFFMTFGEDDERFILTIKIDNYGEPLLTLAPVYSGEADPGSTLVITLFNANGEQIGTQSVVVDAGGNWLATLPGAIVRDYPQTIQITQTPASYNLNQEHGYNLRPYYATVLNSGHFFYEDQTISRIETDRAEVSTRAMNQVLNKPFNLGEVSKHFYEQLSVPGHPTGR